MVKYMLEERNRVFIFDLTQTERLLHDALRAIYHISSQSGVILFVGTSPQYSTLVRRVALLCGEYYSIKRWIPGTVRNCTLVLGSYRQPDLAVILNTTEDRLAVNECYAACIPTVGIVDSNANSPRVSYPIPANDDTETSLQLLMHLISRAVHLGKRRADAEKSANTVNQVELEDDETSRERRHMERLEELSDRYHLTPKGAETFGVGGRLYDSAMARYAAMFVGRGDEVFYDGLPGDRPDKPEEVTENLSGEE